MTLYRGDSHQNRRRRTYGMAWSANVETARSFAETDHLAGLDGLTVLLAADVPAAEWLTAGHRVRS